MREAKSRVGVVEVVRSSSRSSVLVVLDFLTTRSPLRRRRAHARTRGCPLARRRASARPPGRVLPHGLAQPLREPSQEGDVAEYLGAARAVALAHGAYELGR